jgi:hypothetical protein
MPLPDDFATESLYTPDQWFVHDLVSFDVEAHRLVTSTDTSRLGPLVDAQRPLPGHPKHVPGAVVIQITGTIGVLHAAYGLGLRPSKGWVGFGTAIRQARFRRLGTIGAPIIATAECTRHRHLRGTWHLEYRFHFAQDGETLYESEQSAAWSRAGA